MKTRLYRWVCLLSLCPLLALACRVGDDRDEAASAAGDASPPGDAVARDGGASWCRLEQDVCHCRHEPYTDDGGTPVPNCDTPPSSTPWVCAIDLQSPTEAIDCYCEAYTCVSGTPSFAWEDEADADTPPQYCLCEVEASRWFVDGGTPVASCGPAQVGGGACYAAENGITFWGSENGCGCMSPGADFPNADTAGATPSDGGLVPSCPATPTYIAEPDASYVYNFTAPSCAGLTWAPPSPPAASSSGGSDDTCGGGCGYCSYCTYGVCFDCGFDLDGLCAC